MTNYTRALVLGAALAATVSSFGVYAADNAGVKIKETKLVEVPKENLRSLTISPDNKQVAYMRQEGGKSIVTVNGKDQKAYDWIIPASLTYSSDSSVVAYVAQDAKGMIAVVGGKESDPYYEIAGPQLFLVPSSAKFAWKAKDKSNGGNFIVNDFVKGGEYAELTNPVFSADGKRSVYRVGALGMKNLILDGKQMTPYDEIPNGSFTWSPDSSRYAYVAVKGVDDKAKGVIVSDGKEIFEGKGIGVPLFSPDNKRMAFTALSGEKKMQLYVDGKPVDKAYDRVIGETVKFSPDSKRIGYIAMTMSEATTQPAANAADAIGKLFYVIDGVEQNSFNKLVVGSMLFSPDSKEAAYVVDTSNPGESQKLKVVINNRGGEAYDEIQGIQYSPDSKHLAFLAKQGVRTFVVIDNNNGVPYETVASLQYSSDSKQLYIGKRNDKWYAVQDQVEGAGYMGINNQTACFSPDGKHIIYQAVKNAPTTQPGDPATLDSVFVLDKTEVASFKDTLPGSKIIWDNNYKFRSIVVKGETGFT